MNTSLTSCTKSINFDRCFIHRDNFCTPLVYTGTIQTPVSPEPPTPDPKCDPSFEPSRRGEPNHLVVYRVLLSRLPLGGEIRVAGASDLVGGDPLLLMLFGPQGQRLHDPRVRLAALPELLQGQPVVVVLVHLVEDLVHPLLGRVAVVLGRLLPLESTTILLGNIVGKEAFVVQ